MGCQMSRKSVLRRAQQKSCEGEFLYELQEAYELSPKLSEEILRTAKNMLLCSESLREGQIDITVVGIEERAGKMMEQMERKQIRLTLDDGEEDRAVLRDHGREGLRRVRIARMTEEAIEQGGILSQEDLSRHLLVSVRTIKRDIAMLKGRGITITTRGVLQNIGRGQTHKVKIVELYLGGMTYSEITRKMHHSVGSIKRYLEQFTKVAMAAEHGLGQEEDISAVTGLSPYLVRQHQALLGQVRADRVRRGNLREMIERMRYRPELKKRLKWDGKQAVPTTGGRR